MTYEDTFKSIHAQLEFYKFSIDFLVEMKDIAGDFITEIDPSMEDIQFINDVYDMYLGNGDIWKNFV